MRLLGWGAARSSGLVALTSFLVLGGGFARAAFTPLTPLPAPRVIHSSEAYPGDAFVVGHLFDGVLRTEYSSNAHGTNTLLELEFPTTVRIGAFRHLDRNDPATVAASELIFRDAEGRVTGTVPVAHVNTRGGETWFVLPEPISGRRVTWRVTRLGPQQYGTVGGAELSFFAAGETEARPTGNQVELRALPFLQREGDGMFQPVHLIVRHPYAEPVEALLRVEGVEPRALTLRPGANQVEVKLRVAERETTLAVALEAAGQTVTEARLPRKPVRPLTVYILPHSHTDIGYTAVQTDIERRQVQNLVDGIAHARRTAGYPEGARFVWNVEVLWAADLYLRRLSETQRAQFLEAVRQGHVSLCGMYLNELTGLCRPEELVRLFRYGTKLAQQSGVPIDSVMISDVPGYTWGTVPAMAHAGIKYFSTAPNYFDRIGTILREWENKPFWWVGPDEQTRVLVWIPFWGYALSHRYHEMSPRLVEEFCDGLEQRAYPYEIAYVRWSGHGDNAVPDPAICEFVKDWNAKYASPRFIISGVSAAFRALEERHGAQLPVVRGDWTPYWEDGAGSSALETAMNRHSSDRLVQAEALFALRNPSAYPAAAFENAWSQVLLYSEHTWGAWCSVSEPERKETREQWAIKKGYAEDADRQSRELLRQALATRPTGSPSPAESAAQPAASSVDVLNTLSWPRTELVVVPPELSHLGDCVTDAKGKPVPSQRLRSGELAFLATEVPPYAGYRYQLTRGSVYASPKVRASAIGARLDSGIVSLRADDQTGGIAKLTLHGLEANFADNSSGEALNDYLYLRGDDTNHLERNGPVRISLGEPGPLVASLVIESDAPGCRSLRRELRVVAGQDYVEIHNRLDKARLEAKSYLAPEGKESVNFAFPFQVPDGEMWLDLPLGRMRPELDQLPSACKNWFTVGRWVDVSNRERGITWVTLDAPLVQVGGVTANLLNSQTNPDVWRKRVEPTQKIYSWAMNNHWGTNYRAYQEGLTLFRFLLRPHRRPDPAEASRFATGISQPLLVVRADGPPPSSQPRLTVEPADVLVTALKPSDDGKAWIVRLFGASAEPHKARLRWNMPEPTKVYLSDTSEQRRQPAGGTVLVPGNGLVTLRAEFGTHPQ